MTAIRNNAIWKLLEPVNIRHKELETFYQSKYAHYKRVSRWVCALIVVVNLLYFIGDCFVVKGFSNDTLFPRCISFAALAVFMWAYKKYPYYRRVMPFFYLVPYAVMWSTIWAMWYLPSTGSTRELFVVLQFAFMAIGLCVPLKYAVVYHLGFFLSLVVSHLFIHYDSFFIILTMAILVYVVCVMIEVPLEHSYVNFYLNKKKLESLFTTDQLTQVYNRHQLENLLDLDGTLLDVDDDEDAATIMLDIDHFKNVNDTYGHDAGDKVLVFLTEILSSCIRDCDYIIRWGGEEFVVILHDADESAASFVAERIRKRVEGTKNEVCPVTVSVGYTVYDHKNFHASVEQADAALYYAKNHGRNQICAYSDLKALAIKEAQEKERQEKEAQSSDIADGQAQNGQDSI
ncbi:MAG: diguanylate cyclase [Eubacterium sp.]|nr:diguanylate cyclase [Eubacterium sp.]